MASIMDFFRGTQQTQEPTATGEGAGQQQQQQQQQGTLNSPNSPTEESQPSEDVSGLDAFKDIWNNDPNDANGESDPEAAYDPSSGLNINPEEIQKAVASMDFAQVLDNEMLSQISEGGEAAQKAFAGALNKVSQHVFSQSMIANATLVKQALSQSTGAFDSRAERLLKQSKVSETVSSQNPVFNHPAAKPMVRALEQQLMQKHPQASHEEIAQQANKMFASFAEEFGKPERAKQQQQSKSSEPDWEAFFSN